MLGIRRDLNLETKIKTKSPGRQCSLNSFSMVRLAAQWECFRSAGRELYGCYGGSDGPTPILLGHLSRSTPTKSTQGSVDVSLEGMACTVFPDEKTPATDRAQHGCRACPYIQTRHPYKTRCHVFASSIHIFSIFIMTVPQNGISAATPAYTVSNPFRTRILSGQICAVMTAKLMLRNEMAMFCRMAGIDAIFIDMEHSTHDLGAVAQLALACNYAGVSPIVRVPSKSHWHISRAFDAGAAAVVVPHVDSVAEVQAIVRAGKFPPMGARGSTNNQAIFNFQHVPFEAQNALLNKETMLIPMIETPAAVDIADEILAVEGVDGVLIGSNDLCTDLGIPGQYDNPAYQDAVTKIVLAGKKAGKPIGIGGIGGRVDLLEKWFEMGATWSLSGQDSSILQAGIKKVGQEYAAINQRLQQLNV